jgi:hypothetical protein
MRLRERSVENEAYIWSQLKETDIFETETEKTETETETYVFSKDSFRHREYTNSKVGDS